MPYSPKYISIDDVPVKQVPDDYDDGEKEDALEFAEASLELDINGGSEIPQSSFTQMMAAALKQKATCELVKGAEDPTSTKLGDLADDGSNKSDYANTFCERYTELVDKLNGSDVLEDLLEDSSGRTDPYVYNTSDPDS